MVVAILRGTMVVVVVVLFSRLTSHVTFEYNYCTSTLLWIHVTLQR